MQYLKSFLNLPSDQLKNLSTRIFNRKSLVISQTTPYEVIDTYKHASIRFYESNQKKYKEPIVFVSPLAINMSIYDLFPYRSLVKYLNESGFDIYLIEWGELNYSHKHLDFLYFIDEAIPACIDKILNHSKSNQISLHGWSMAGLFVSLYTASHQPACVKNLIVLGSPIDSYASGYIGKVFERANQYISKNSKLDYLLTHRIIPTKYTQTPGLLNVLGFKIIDPKGWYISKKQLFNNLNDLVSLSENATLTDFLNNMIDYPGGIVQDMVFNVWLKNPLKSGFIQFKNKEIQLKNITCPLMIGAGSRDQIVSEASAKTLSTLTSSQDFTFTLITGGHLGIMSNQNSASDFWPALSDWLAKRSTKL
jgi:poly(3-hydroxyalkanoate) synthetase